MEKMSKTYHIPAKLPKFRYRKKMEIIVYYKQQNKEWTRCSEIQAKEENYEM